MGVPDPDVSQKDIGRYGVATLHCNWTSTDNDDITNVYLVDLNELPAKYGNPRFKVTKIDWTCGSSVQVVVDFDSLGERKTILAIPEDSTVGSRDFSGEPDGGMVDPNKDVPGNIVVDTDGSLPGDRLDLKIEYIVKGERLRNS